MLTITVILFALAAIFGLILISYVLRGKETPKGIVFAWSYSSLSPYYSYYLCFEQ